jgi:hypothetical protein
MLSGRSVATLFVCLASVLPAVGQAPDAIMFTDLPAPEIDLLAPLPKVPADDQAPLVFGLTDGRACTLYVEGWSLLAQTSSDAGSTFGTEVLVTGPPSGLPVLSWHAVLSSGGRLYVAFTVADPGGNAGLRFTRSDDMGLTWSAPQVLTTAGDASHGVRSARIAAGPGERVAVIYRGGDTGDPYVRSSADGGGSWSAAARVDAGVPANTWPAGWERLAFDGSGRLFVVFVQNRGPSWGAWSVWTARSLDGGATFQAEQNISGAVSAGPPDITVTNSGYVLIAYWYSPYIKVHRSTNQGQSYATTVTELCPLTPVGPYVAPTTATGVQLYWLEGTGMNGSVKSKRSTNEGQSFGTTVTHTSTAVGPGTVACTATIAMTRTSAGVWVLAWNDIRDDDGLVQRSDVYARSSTDGATWGAEVRVDGGAAGAAQSSLGAITAVSTNDVVLVYRDARDNPRSFNLYRNRSVANPLAFGPDARIDADAGLQSPRGMTDVVMANDGAGSVYSAVSGFATYLHGRNDVVVTADGAGHVYAAFSAFVHGAFTDVFVATSHDGGHSFGTPVRVGGFPAGTMMAFFPVIAAEPGGHVYLAYEINTGAPASGFGIREIRFNRSLDFGATWQASDRILDSSMENSGPGYYTHWDRAPKPQVFAGAGGRVFVTWTNETDVFLARSTDFGANFTKEAVDQDSRTALIGNPEACVSGDLILIAYEANKLGSSDSSVWAVTSKDAGVSWAPRVQVRPESAPTFSDDPAVACDGAGGAVVVWADFRSGDNLGAIRANRFTGTSWLGDVAVAGPGIGHNDYPRVTYASPTVAIAVWDNVLGPEVYAARSTDGGTTFPSYQRLDASPPSWARGASQFANATADGTGNVWTAWMDTGAGAFSVVARHSSDFGATWGGIRRVHRDTPQGAYLNSYFPLGRGLTAAPGVAYFSWVGQRGSWSVTPLFNAWDLDDLDRDGAAAGADCNDEDAAVVAAPAVVSGVLLQPAEGATRLSWNSQDAAAGAGTVYDVASGWLSDLLESRGYGDAGCLAAAVADTPYDDTSADPAAGDGIFRLIRARNTCGAGSYGDSSLLPDPRDALDAASPCP